MSANNKSRPRNSSLHANHRQRMKNKFLENGIEVFSEHEIMEILLYYALPQVDTNEIAHELINKGGSFVGAFNLSVEEMKTVSGIKDQAATFLKLIPAIARYYSMQEAKLASHPSMTYQEIADFCVKAFIGVNNERLLALYFDASMHMITHKFLGDGNAFGVASDIRTITDGAVKYGASNIVLAHNHPSASIVPSTADIDSTKRLRRLLAEFRINLVEHFVVSGDMFMGVIKTDEEIVSMFS